ncbi:MAG: YggT family protein [Myxococcota bacterium]
MAILFQLLEIYSWIIIISALLSWFPIDRGNPLIQFLNAATEPVFAPIRALIRPEMTGGIDLSPLIVLFGINVLKNIIAQQLY